MARVWILVFLCCTPLVICGCVDSNQRGEKNAIVMKDMHTLKMACELYFEEFGNWPEGQADLFSPPYSDQRKYPTFIKKLMKDPWRREYIWAVGKDNAPRFICYGSDGLEGGDGASCDTYYSALDGLIEQVPIRSVGR